MALLMRRGEEEDMSLNNQWRSGRPDLPPLGTCSLFLNLEVERLLEMFLSLFRINNFITIYLSALLDLGD